MRANSSSFWAIAAALVLAVVSFAAGRNGGICKARRDTINDTIVRVDTVTVTQVRIDTVERVRTVTAYLPAALPDPEDAGEPMDTIDYGLPLPDSVAVEIPISRYVAQEDSLYRVVATGYAVSFDEITVYPRTVTVTQTVVQQRRSRWGIGIHAGYGATVQGGAVRLSPYIGAGVQYNFVSW